MLPLLLACRPAPLDTGTPIAPPAYEDAPIEVVPESPPRTLTAPASFSVDCADPIPLEGKVDCAVRIAWPEGDAAYEGRAGVGIHGRSSSGFPKQQFAIELRDAAGNNAPTDLFGMGKDSDWLLNGMYLDRALLRNKLAYDLYRDMGNVAPESVYGELTLNGAYAGVYVLGERIERGGDRVDIPVDGPDSFILRADETGLPSRVQYGHWAPADPEAGSPEEAARLTTFEDAILGDGSAIFDEADLDGFVDFVLLEETVKNNDGYFLSHHLYTGSDGLLRFIPWDLDLTLGQPSYNDNERSDLWILYRPDLVARPALQEAFRARLVSRWTELRGGLLADDALLARIEGYRAFLGPAVDRNWERWDITQVENVGFPIYSVTSSDEEYAHVEAWLVERLAWMDQNVSLY